MLIVLRFDKGSILTKGYAIPHGSYNARTGAYRAQALYYKEIQEHLELSGTDYRDEALDYLSCPSLSSDITLRDYQKRALEAWRAAGRRGVVVLPTGAGKTVIALKAIEELEVSTLVVVPTLVLVDQWRERLEEAFGVEVGVVGGGKQLLRGLTVATYDSAS